MSSFSFEVLERLSTAYHWKPYYFEQEDGKIYSRQSNKYMTLDEAIEEFAKTISGVDNDNSHVRICQELNEIYERKNHDYGDSFHKTFVEEGLAMCRIRLNDKLERFKTLSRGADAKVTDESLIDTLKDLANYAIMTIMEIEKGSLKNETE